MNRYISYGGGVNSTAMAILLLTDPRFKKEREEGIRIIMADTGDEWPETYAFIRDHFEPWLRSVGHRGIEWVKSEETLFDYCVTRFIIPSRLSRWCTDKFKIRPIVKKLEAEGMLPVVQYLGIHYGEMEKRMRTSGRDDIQNEFPLCYLKIDQQGCLDVIVAAGLPIPMKSGCFYCPHSKKRQVIDLEERHPELFEKAVMMEANNSAFNWKTNAKGKLVRFLLFSKKYALPEWIIKGRITKAKPGGGCAAACFTGKMTESGT